MRWSYLTDGDSYDPTGWQVGKGAGNSPVVPQSRPARPPSADAFGSYALRDAALDLAAAGLSASTTAATAETAPRFVVGLTKDSGFAAYAAGGAGPSSFTGMAVSIQAG
ncbi:hypothetical protein ABGB16_10270 [Micromonospora sp. B11E3]|uniref:hypothetical protein n=1 Tax=Micromonospora sp. B11E3 TaxID=3153562 RepID=UPI00325E945E